MGKIHELPKSSSRLLTSSQIITSVYCIVKELVENALDGASKNVEVKLEDYGLEKIEVLDNGGGINKNDIEFVARPHFTSKITTYSDLEKINTYGFRGEALGAICAVANLIITTKSSDEAIGYTANFNHDGQVISTKPCPCNQGSTVSVQSLFKNIPVRRQYYRSEKNKKDDLRKIQDLLVAFGCIQNDVRFVLYHNKNLIWQKPALPSTKDALLHILGHSVVDHLKYSEYVDDQNQRKIETYLPRLESAPTCALSSPSRSIVSINKRPVRMKELDKLLKQYYNEGIQNTGKARYPICFISFTLALTEVDVNIEPNKTNVMLRHSEEILSELSKILKTFYTVNSTDENQNVHISNNVEPNQEPKSTSDFLTSLKDKCDTTFQQTKLSFISKSPVSVMRNSQDKNSILNNINNHSTAKTDIMSKKDIAKVGIEKELNKKKLKTTIQVSKKDIDHHISSLKNFFSGDKTSGDDISFNSFSSVPRVTVERFIPNQSSLSPETERPETITESNTTFAVNTNMCIDNNSHVGASSTVNRKRHFSDSSVHDIKFVENIQKKPAVEVNAQDGEAWSRGMHPSGGVFQPVKVLQPKTVNVLNSVPSRSSDFVNEPKKEQKNLSYERKLTAFDIFCRNNRLEVAAQSPGFSNQQIALLLSEKWNHLSPEEKAVYKNMLDKDYKQQVKKKERLQKIVMESLSQRKGETTPCTSHKRKMKLKIRDKSVTVSIEQIKEFYQGKNREVPPSDEFDLINYLAPGIWICSRKEKLSLLNTFRLQETVIYQRLLETFQFDAEPLAAPEIITVSNIGEECMEILMELSKRNIDSNGTVCDERLTANGFEIKFIKEEEVSIQLVGITNQIAFYGLVDFKELLIKTKDCSAKLSRCRPGKVMLYLQSEANRMSRQSPACQRAQDVKELLFLNNSKYYECIHHKPFFHDLWNIVNT